MPFGVKDLSPTLALPTNFVKKRKRKKEKCNCPRTATTNKHEVKFIIETIGTKIKFRLSIVGILFKIFWVSALNNFFGVRIAALN